MHSPFHPKPFKCDALQDASGITAAAFPVGSREQEKQALESLCQSRKSSRRFTRLPQAGVRSPQTRSLEQKVERGQGC